MEKALIVVGVCLVLYFAIRLMLQYYFPPDT